MHLVGQISMEGGPVLIGDANVLRLWRGEFGEDYKKLCRLYDEADPAQTIMKINIGEDEREAIAWEAGGEGTIDIFEMHNGLMLLRGWVNEDSDIDGLARAPISGRDSSGELTVPSKRLAILWSPEDGSIIHEQDLFSSSLRPTGSQSMEGSCLLVNLETEKCAYFCDQVSIRDATAIRFWLMEGGLERE